MMPKSSFAPSVVPYGATTGIMSKSGSSLSPLYTPYYPKTQKFQEQLEGCAKYEQQLDANVGYEDYGALPGVVPNAPDGTRFYSYRDYSSGSPESYDASCFYHWGNAWQWGDPSSGNYQYGTSCAYLPSLSNSLEHPIVEEDCTSSSRETGFLSPPTYGQTFVALESAMPSCQYRNRLCEDSQFSYAPLERYSSVSFVPSASHNNEALEQGRSWIENASKDGNVFSAATPDLVSQRMQTFVDDLSLSLGAGIVTEETVFVEGKSRSIIDTKTSVDGSITQGVIHGQSQEEEKYPATTTAINLNISVQQNSEQMDLLHSSSLEIMEGGIDSGDDPCCSLLNKKKSFSTGVLVTEEGEVEVPVPVEMSMSESTCDRDASLNGAKISDLPGTSNENVSADSEQGSLDTEGLYGHKIFPEDAVSAVNGHQYLISSIYNLSAVLVKNQSTEYKHGFNDRDLEALQHSIFLLSHNLLHLSNSMASIHYGDAVKGLPHLQPLEPQDQKALFKDKVADIGGSGCNQLAGLHDFLSSNLQDLLKMSCKSADASAGADYNLNTDVADKLSIENVIHAVQTSSAKTSTQKSSEELVELQSEVLKLQEEVAYERNESNVTLEMYKKLWEEAQVGMERYRSEAGKAKEELQSLRQLLREVQHSDPCALDNNGMEMNSIHLPMAHHVKGVGIESMEHSLGNDEGSCENFSDFVTILSDDSGVYESKKSEDCSADLIESSGDGLPISDKLLPGYFDPPESAEGCSNVRPISFPDAHEAISRYTLILARNGSSDVKRVPNDDSGISGVKTGNRDSLFFNPSNDVKRVPTDVKRVPSDDSGISGVKTGNRDSPFFNPSNASRKEVAERLSLLLRRPAFDLNAACDSITCASGPALEANEPLTSGGCENVQSAISSESFPSSVMLLQDEISDAITLKQGSDGRGNTPLMDADLVLQDIIKGTLSDGHAKNCFLSWNTCDEDEIICLRPSDADNQPVRCRGDSDWEHIRMPSV